MILSLSCHVGWILNGRLVVQALTLCLGLYCSAGSTGTRAAAQATCTQTIAEFCRDLGSRAKQLETNNEGASAAADGQHGNKYNDAIPVFQFILSRMEEVLKYVRTNQTTIASERAITSLHE